MMTSNQGIDGEGVRDWALDFATAFADQAEEFAELDRKMGDGDFADNIGGGLALATPRIRALTDPGPGDALVVLGETFLDEVGGTSGPLFGLLFSALGRAARQAQRLDGESLARGLRDALDAIVRVGGASVGDKTLVDSLGPAADAASAQRDAPVDEALSRIALAAQEGAEATASLLARRGRGSYVGEHARGVVDPGAHAIALFLGCAPSER